MTKWCMAVVLLYYRFPPGPVPPCPESTPLPPQVVGQVIESLIYLDIYHYIVCTSKLQITTYLSTLLSGWQIDTSGKTESSKLWTRICQ